MKRKILYIEDDIKRIIASVCDEKFWINRYGAYDVDPKHLVFWICVDTDEMKLKLQSDIPLMNELRKILIKHDYPKQARPSVYIDFESQETVDRESGGNWYHHFK